MHVITEENGIRDTSDEARDDTKGDTYRMSRHRAYGGRPGRDESLRCGIESLYEKLFAKIFRITNPASSNGGIEYQPDKAVHPSHLAQQPGSTIGRIDACRDLEKFELRFLKIECTAQYVRCRVADPGIHEPFGIRLLNVDIHSNSVRLVACIGLWGPEAEKVTSLGHCEGDCADVSRIGVKRDGKSNRPRGRCREGDRVQAVAGAELLTEDQRRWADLSEIAIEEESACRLAHHRRRERGDGIAENHRVDREPGGVIGFINHTDRGDARFAGKAVGLYAERGIENRTQYSARAVQKLDPRAAEIVEIAGGERDRSNGPLEKQENRAEIVTVCGKRGGCWLSAIANDLPRCSNGVLVERKCWVTRSY